MESLDRASNDQSTLEGYPNEADAYLEQGVPVVSSLNIEEVGERELSRVVTTLVLPLKPADTDQGKRRLPDRMLLSTYVSSLERIHTLTGMVALDPKGVLEIVHCCSPFN